MRCRPRVFGCVREPLGELRPKYDFQLLVADDDDPIGKRVESIANWAGGFLAGFAAGLNVEHSELPVDVQKSSRTLFH